MIRFLILTILTLFFIQCSPKIIPVHKEPMHRPVFESRAARILDIRFPSGDTCLLHEHNTNYCYVMLKGGKLSLQNAGKEFNTFTLPDGFTGGEFEIPMQSVIHRITNLEKDTMRFIAVENLQPTTHPIYKYHPHPNSKMVENNKTFRVDNLTIPPNQNHSLHFSTPMLMVNRLAQPFLLNEHEINETWRWWKRGEQIEIENNQSDTLQLICIHLK